VPACIEAFAWAISEVCCWPETLTVCPESRLLNNLKRLLCSVSHTWITNTLWKCLVLWWTSASCRSRGRSLVRLFRWRCRDSDSSPDSDLDQCVHLKALVSVTVRSQGVVESACKCVSIRTNPKYNELRFWYAVSGFNDLCCGECSIFDLIVRSLLFWDVFPVWGGVGNDFGGLHRQPCS